MDVYYGWFRTITVESINSYENDNKLNVRFDVLKSLKELNKYKVGDKIKDGTITKIYSDQTVIIKQNFGLTVITNMFSINK